jgi:hypothetical protein
LRFTNCLYIHSLFSGAMLSWGWWGLAVHNKREKISLDPTKDLGELRSSGNPFPDLETLANKWQFIRT